MSCKLESIERVSSKRRCRDYGDDLRSLKTRCAPNTTKLDNSDNYETLATHNYTANENLNNLYTYLCRYLQRNKQQTMYVSMTNTGTMNRSDRLIYLLFFLLTEACRRVKEGS